MLTLKVLSALLHYPDQALVAHVDELREALHQDGLVQGERRQAIERHLERLQSEDLLDLQAEYVETFDRGRARSLHLFEHVHGESRDRGQAMVELQNVYRENGFDIDVPELPDYLPLFLEFLAHCPPEEAAAWLRESADVL
jgi:nitrate reductase delta subunit